MNLTSLKRAVSTRTYPVVPGSTPYWQPWVGDSRIFALGDGYWAAFHRRIGGADRWLRSVLFR